MITGLGIDLIEKERINNAMKKSDRFCKRILSDRENVIFQSITSWQRKVEYLAGRFAAKEAYAKASGTGIGKEMAFKDIEVLPDSKGKPELYFKGEKNPKSLVSISHGREIIIAEVIIQEG
ncbi:holo-ACP synthase [Salinibacillus xinjiangensis]|uniref:Holo-[acyl-carrier-protein] synthase n=1 Tax=Salinibacillus xinjiangensis TaxID=1229268 RepID=A0A6G1X8F3_9BACI|nr:holo-ACP synthase [Salinibacillus xinjiangensis]MRG87222.1 holo-[acyl-carrier-protein] synthase [Salinibacillus xinjiangensis]